MSEKKVVPICDKELPQCDAGVANAESNPFMPFMLRYNRCSVCNVELRDGGFFIEGNYYCTDDECAEKGLV